MTTGHADGLVTLDLAESGDAHREAMREQMGEPYRTVLGHLRHEVGHYFFERLARDEPARERARALFGDEREDYAAALERHYESGPPADWGERHVSAYATMHPSEDWAETFAHYLHIRDTLQTAAAYRVTHRDRAPRPPHARARLDGGDHGRVAAAEPRAEPAQPQHGRRRPLPVRAARAGGGQARARARPGRAPVTDRELAAAAARAAAQIALARQGDAGRVSAKDAPTDVVSEVDRAAERAAIELIARERPGDGYLGEEGAERAGERTWVVDALDGTLNYLHGLSGWCAAVALEDEHGALAAAVCDPVRGELFTAARGDGATCNGAVLNLPPRARSSSTRPLVATFLHAPKRALPGVIASLRAPARRGRLAADHGLRDARARQRRRGAPARLDPAGHLPLGLGPGRAAGRRGRRPRGAHARRPRLVHRRRPGAVRGALRALAR